MVATTDIDYLPPAGGKLYHTTAPVLGDELDDGSRVIVHGGMWPSQNLWWDLENHVRMFIGGYGSGKTLTLCKRMIGLAIVNAPIPCAIVSPTYPLARHTIVTTLVELLNGLEQWHDYWRRRGLSETKIKWSYKKTAPLEFEIHFQRGRTKPRVARILVYSGEDPEKLKGPNLAAVGIDEPFIQEQAVFEQMFIRARHPRAVKREVNLTGTPEQLNWGYDLAEGDLSKKYDVGMVQASTLENKALPRSYVEALVAAFDPKVAQAYLHGLFVNLATGLVYYSFDRDENVVELPMPEGANLGAGMDFNVNPMASCVFWYVEKGSYRHIHYFDEIELPNSDTLSMGNLLRDTYGTRGLVRPYSAEGSSDLVLTTAPLLDVWPDANAGRSTSSPGGKTDYDTLEKDCGFVVNKRRSNPHVRDRRNTINGLLRPYGGRVRMTFSPRCKKLIKYQMLYSHELLNKESQKRMSHLLDARDYPAENLFPTDRDTLKRTRVIGA